MSRRPVVLTVVGARPQFVKVAPLTRALRRRLREVLVHTGQHYDAEMSQSFFDQLGIPAPDHHLGIGSGTHGRMTGRMLEALERVMLAVEPELVVVLGDTNSTLAGALAAAKLAIPVAHVEAGLRSFDDGMPEELNRRLTDQLSALLFCPTSAAVRNLRGEGITRGVARVGDVMLDAVLQNRARAARLPEPPARPAGPFFFATVHRQENTDDPRRLRAIVRALSRLPHPVLFPVHPRTRKRLRALGLGAEGAVALLRPLPYLETLRLLGEATAVLTDSGGMQKEAFILGTPCLTLRDSTEWVETLSARANRLVGADTRRIVTEAVRLAWRPRRVRGAARFYGDGRASERIASAILRFLRRGRGGRRRAR